MRRPLYVGLFLIGMSSVVLSAASESSNDSQNLPRSEAKGLDSARKCLSELLIPGWSAAVVSASSSASPLVTSSAAIHFATLSGEPSIGAASNDEILSEFGLIQVVSQTFQRGQRQISVHVYQFKSSDGAFAAYRLLHHGASTVLRRGDGSSEDEQSISFWKGPFFIQIIGSSQEDEESKEVVRAIADRLDSSIRAHADLPAQVTHLPVMDRVHGSEKLVMGNMSARRFFPVPYVEKLRLDHMRGAAVADYQLRYPHPERLRLFCISYDDPALASDAYNQYLTNFDGDDQAKELASDTSIHKVSGGYILCQLHGDLLILISGARKRHSPILLARQCY